MENIVIRNFKLTLKNKKINILLFILLIVIILISASENIYAAAQNKEDKVLSKSKIESMMEELDVPGCAITYIKDGKVVLDSGFGKANKFTQSEITNKSVFEAGSNGKMLEAYICLKLQKEGKLDLDKPATDYIGDEWLKNSDFTNEITIRELLSHTSGLSNSYELNVDKKIYFKPGTNYKYSGVGYMYLQKIIEKVTGKTFEECAKDYVFEPLKMDNSSFNERIRSNKVSPHINPKSLGIYLLAPFLLFFIIIYAVSFGAGAITKFKYYSKITSFKFSVICACVLSFILSFMVLSKLIIPLLIIYTIGAIVYLYIRKYKSKKLYYLSFIILIFALSFSAYIEPKCVPIGNDIAKKTENAAYSLTTTNEDMSKFVCELLNVYKGKDKILKSMFNEEVKIDENNSWGLGIGIEKSGNKTTYWHSGINPGFQSFIVLDADDNSAVIVLTNSDNGLNFSKQIAESLLNVDGNWDIKK